MFYSMDAGSSAGGLTTPGTVFGEEIRVCEIGRLAGKSSGRVMIDSYTGTNVLARLARPLTVPSKKSMERSRVILSSLDRPSRAVSNHYYHGEP